MKIKENINTPFQSSNYLKSPHLRKAQNQNSSTKALTINKKAKYSV